MRDSDDPADIGNRQRSPRSAAKTDAWLSALAYWYLTGILVALGFSFGSYLAPHPSFDLPEKRDWLDKVTWMDGRWYKQIATEGYHYDAKTHSSVAFFPVYPLLARGLAAVAGLRAEAALLIVSNLSLLTALGMLGLYVRARTPEAPNELADYTLLAAALFPTGCFFRLAYSESTCLLLMVLALYSIVRRWPLWTVALLVGLATAARPVGVALLAPLAIHIGRHTDGSYRRRLGLLGARLAVYLPLGCWGLAAFLAYQYHAFGEPLATVKAQEHWRVRPAVSWRQKAMALATLEPVAAVYDRDSRAYWGNDKHRMPWFSLQFANPIFFLAAVVLVALGVWRRWLSFEEASLAALLLLIPYLTRAHEMGMRSMGRFVLIVFPIYLVLAQILIRLPGPMRAALHALAGFFLAAYTALYAAAYVIF